MNINAANMANCGEYEEAVSLTTVGRYHKAWGMTPQKPVRRAYEGNDAVIKHWLVAEYPALVGDAKRERATILGRRDGFAQ